MGFLLIEGCSIRVFVLEPTFRYICITQGGHAVIQHLASHRVDVIVLRPVCPSVGLLAQLGCSRCNNGPKAWRR